MPTLISDVQINLRNPGPDRSIRLRLDKLARQFEAAGNKFEHISRQVLDKHKALSIDLPQPGNFLIFFRIHAMLSLTAVAGATPAQLHSASQQRQQQQQQQLTEPLLEDNQVRAITTCCFFERN